MQSTLSEYRIRDLKIYLCNSKTCIYLLPGFNTLIGKVREGGAGNEAAHARGDMQVPILQNNLPLANHHEWGSTQLHALKDVVLSSLKAKI